ncbi:MAG: hypothetical protein ACI93S_000001 [Ancylomarina sp.]|jgi:hypothetical protein
MNSQFDVLAGQVCPFFLKEKHLKFIPRLRETASADPFDLKAKQNELLCSNSMSFLRPSSFMGPSRKSSGPLPMSLREKIIQTLMK